MHGSESALRQQSSLGTRRKEKKRKEKKRKEKKRKEKKRKEEWQQSVPGCSLLRL